MTYSMSLRERELLFALAYSLTGTSSEIDLRKEVIVSNIERRILASGEQNLRGYLEYVQNNDLEFEELFSGLTIHTTGWFREFPHFERLSELVTQRITQSRKPVLKLVSLGCSTGEEVFSLALALMGMKNDGLDFDYTIDGIDVDPLSVKRAHRAIYSIDQLRQIPEIYHKWLLFGSGKSEGRFTLRPEIRRRCRFSRGNLIERAQRFEDFYDFVICRNVLIYFSRSQLDTILSYLVARLKQGGYLILGHSEAIDAQRYDLSGIGNAIYVTNEAKVRPISSYGRSSNDVNHRFLIKERPQRQFLFRPDVILLGASTGGTTALSMLLKSFPKSCPPVVVVQHITLNFAHSFAEYLASASGLILGDCQSGTPLKSGHLYAALGDYHIGLAQTEGALCLERFKGDPVNGHRPSVDHLFLSAAKLSRVKIAAVILTGMGKDGAVGMVELRKQGALTFAQDESSSVVFGMPKAAINLKAVGYIANVPGIRKQLDLAMAVPQTRLSA